jgi:tetratricopeptide (TPR) repeat protein
LCSAGVFSGGAALSTACAVAQASTEAFERLVDKQLLTLHTTTNGEPRLGMLETVRQFAGGLLAGRADAVDVRRRHAQAFGRLVQELSEQFRRTNAREVAKRFERDIDNVRGALRWATVEGEGRLALRLAASFHEYLHQQAPDEAHRWLSVALATRGAERPTRERAEALWRLAMAPAWVTVGADFLAAEVAAKESLRLAEQLHDVRGRADALLTRGALMYLQHRRTEALEFICDAVACARDARDTVMLADALNVQALCVETVEAALQAGDEATALYAQNGNTQRYAIVTSNLSYVALIHAEYNVAGSLIDRAWTAIGDSDDPRARVSALTNQGLLALFLDRYDEAVATLRQCIIAAPDIRRDGQLGELTDGIAAAFAAMGDAEYAATLHGAAQSTNPPHSPPIVERLEARFFAPARERLGEESWQVAWDAGAALGLRDILRLVLEHRVPGASEPARIIDAARVGSPAT